MPFGILHNLTGKISLTFPLEKSHFTTAIPDEVWYCWGWHPASRNRKILPMGRTVRLPKARAWNLEGPVTT